jgi:hypothetical protein
MIEKESDRFVSQLLEDLGPADPPAGFTAGVMSRIVSQQHVSARRTVSRAQEENAMTKKAMWSLAAAATIALAVLSYTGFPSVGRGTEGTIGAAKKAEQPQLTDKDVVLGDTAAQEFLQSPEFDQLMKDPQARNLLADAALNSYLRDPRFANAIRDANARWLLSSRDVAEIFADDVARHALEAQLKVQVASAVGAKKASAEVGKKAAVEAAVKQASAEARGAASVHADLIKNLASDAKYSVLKNDVFRSALADQSLQKTFARTGAAAALQNKAFDNAVNRRDFAAAATSGRLASALGAR